jgi:hypothetical protein
MAQQKTVEEIWNGVKGDNPEYRLVSPDFKAKLQSIYATARSGGPESGIAGLEEFEREVRTAVQAEGQTGSQFAPTLRDDVAKQQAEPTPQGTGAQDSEEKAKQDAAGAQSRVEADAVHSPPFPSAARPLGAEAPGGAANLTAQDAGNAEGEAAGDEDSASTKRGKLPEDFPGRAALEEAGITSYGKLRAVKDLTELPGIGDATAKKIEEALNEKE